MAAPEGFEYDIQAINLDSAMTSTTQEVTRFSEETRLSLPEPGPLDRYDDELQDIEVDTPKPSEVDTPRTIQYMSDTTLSMSVGPAETNGMYIGHNREDTLTDQNSGTVVVEIDDMSSNTSRKRTGETDEDLVDSINARTGSGSFESDSTVRVVEKKTKAEMAAATAGPGAAAAAVVALNGGTDGVNGKSHEPMFLRERTTSQHTGGGSNDATPNLAQSATNVLGGTVKNWLWNMRLSEKGRIFYGLAVSQFVVVSIFQGVIYQEVQFDDSTNHLKLFLYANICLMGYTMYYNWDALHSENTFALLGSMYFELAFILFGVLQIYQYQNATSTGNIANTLTIVNLCAIVAFALGMMVMVPKLRIQFSLLKFKVIGASSKLRYAYNVHVTFVGLNKVIFPFVVAFLFLYAFIALDQTDPEWYLSITGACIIVFLPIYVNQMVKWRSVTLGIIYIVLLLLGIAYFIFKMVTFITGTGAGTDNLTADSAFAFLILYCCLNLVLLFTLLTVIILWIRITRSNDDIITVLRNLEKARAEQHENERAGADGLANQFQMNAADEQNFEAWGI
eukprot:Clim_evm34s215 gene=Clim_evmTU34s215